MNLTRELVREAALINWLEQAADDDVREGIRNELWCIRNGIDTEGLEDITTASWLTSDIIDLVLNSGFRSKHDQAAFLLCTMSEIS